MTIVLAKRHPEGKSLSEALRDDEDNARLQKKHGINKRATLIKAADAALPDGVGETMRPTDEQLKRINQFTRKKVTAEEVVAFTTMSMNDMPDRDDDFFTTDTVKEFASLEAPFSPVGKSYMVDHDYKIANARGRIFGVDTQKVGNDLFLTNEVYVPNTPQFQPFIESIDFGINWAVSVGVMLNGTECSLSFCKAGFSSWGWWCQNGHDKGLYYTEDAEEDSWGYPLPCDSRTAGAEKCLRAFKGARDFYELSQVFLGAQYHAQIDQKILEAAKSAGAPMLLGLSEEEAGGIPLHRLPRKVMNAIERGYRVEEEDGVYQWVDSDRKTYMFDGGDPKSGVVCLGVQTKDSEDEEEVTADGNDQEQLPSGDGDPGGDVQGEPDQGDGNVSDEDLPAPDGAEQGSQPSEVATESEEEEDVPKNAVLAMARKAGLPTEVVKAASDAEGNGLEALLFASAARMKALETENSELKPKAAMGLAYVDDLRKEALDLFLAANAGDGKVETEMFERILDKCSDDPDLLKYHISDLKKQVQAKFPASARRSSFPTDPHDRPKAPEGPPSETERKASRLHA